MDCEFRTILLNPNNPAFHLVNVTQAPGHKARTALEGDQSALVILTATQDSKAEPQRFSVVGQHTQILITEKWREVESEKWN